MEYITNKAELEFFTESERQRELMLLGIMPFPEDKRTDEEKHLSEFKFAITEEHKLIWQHPETEEQLSVTDTYGKGEPISRRFKRWARGMDL